MAIMRPGPEDGSTSPWGSSWRGHMAEPRDRDPAPRLDLGKKMSTPQDLMIEELSLRNNRGSQLFQQRQRRMQRFVFEHPSGYRELPGLGAGGSHRTEKGDPEGTANEWMAEEDAGGQQSYHSELHVAALPQGGPPEVPKKTEKVLQMSKVLNPDALAPGYSGPLKEIPPEKFNVTAIPKGYRSPWQELLGDKDNTVRGENQPPMRPSPWDFRSFNRAPAPFDRALVSDPFSAPAAELDNLSALEAIAHRPSFNRVPQGWVRILPESDEL
ncbi:PREDICTED: myozenin-3 isoform X1 [Pygoscelis adeliae]|uniref:myozenin-3 isoform X1 n=1 Tax=Pygoscelis adeliae TaxID=9238 RepID=UPI0004F4F068|nr:PREDICTED: myozenin-3 isoform X1 [Pygoscelis adeliae]XP_009320916.1 PREDICTED: myozenin-3 isoform X1 [Pygoscelis adeliae]XP_009320917.1 PREDICTED: myozenin-3 isoform X1 [Pygoscelis adeliae]XP_009320918.1 PREDICTED: myozenin-3 isoform X1 [Pygoscelis adeliae]XP_009320919.1 PREDICTED: myozenin-3 isoform X1 [Pygoscelis adeliae]